jgi:hypothetical protein
MRRSDKEITDRATLERILKTTQYITVAMTKDNEPYLVSLSHGYDDKQHCIYFHCAKEGKKLDYLQANPTVWGQALIDEGYCQGECDHRYATVMFKGNVTFIEDREQKWRALSAMTRQLDENAEELIYRREQEGVDSAIIGRIDIEYMTGKKAEGISF